MGKISINPDDAVAGGMLDDVDGVIVSLRAEMFDYGGEADEPVPAVALTIQPDGDDQDEKVQYYSAGSPEKIRPAKDGMSFEGIGEYKGKGLSKSCNAMILFKSIIDSGFPTDKLADDDGDPAPFSIFDGMKCHFNQRPAPKRPGLTQKEGKTILVVTEIKSLPGEGGKKGGAKPKGKPAADEDEDEADPIAEEASELVLEILTSKEYKKSGIDTTALASEAFKRLKGKPNLKKIVQWLNDDDNLKNIDGATFDAKKEVLTLG